MIFESDCFRIPGNSHKFPTEDVSFGDQSRGESSLGFERPAGYIGSIPSHDQDSWNASERCQVIVKLAVRLYSIRSVSAGFMLES